MENLDEPIIDDHHETLLALGSPSPCQICEFVQGFGLGAPDHDHERHG
jgi:hypothetical protein